VGRKLKSKKMEPDGEQLGQVLREVIMLLDKLQGLSNLREVAKSKGHLLKDLKELPLPPNLKPLQDKLAGLIVALSI
jgi:hypothetical protein